MLVEVALPVPLARTFTYRVEDDRLLAPGMRVLVPFGSRRLIGWIAELDAEPDGDVRIRAVERVLDEEPSVPPEILELCSWIADYYVAPLGQVLRAALPAVLSNAVKPEPPMRRRRLLRLTRELPSLRERDEVFANARRQRECYELLESMGGSADTSYLTRQCGFSPDVLKGLVARGLARWVDEVVERDPFSAVAVETPAALTPTPAQAAVLSRLGRAFDDPDRRPFLLRGVTGSGKTLVYIELLEMALRRGRGAIVLVPEIALTPQTVARFRARFGDDVAVLHSGLSDGERYDAWRALRDGRRRIAVGARSAIFAPVRDLGVIVVDEEHEATYKQGEAPRYHAREVAVVRARLEGAVCLLGSATPALETWYNAQTGKYELLELPDRVASRPLPPVQIIDLRVTRTARESNGGLPGSGAGQAARGGVTAVAGVRRAGVLSPALERAIQQRLERGEQTILFLNRRGYSTFVQCRACGAVWQCPDCNVSLTHHRARRRLVCHHCFHHEPVPSVCDACGAEDLSFRGLGTEQVERAVGEAFPSARIARMDVDTTSGKWAHHRILERFGRGAIDILLGTQMIAKGLDFPRVTLVGVIDADVGLHLPDFRAAERTFQLLTQVAGRAGRGPAGGEVLIQTALPGHYVLRAAGAHDYSAFVERELAERKSANYPPFTRMANIVVSGTAEIPVQEAATHVAERAREICGRTANATVTVTGPAPCPIDKIRGRWRWHFLLRSRAAHALGEVCRRLVEEHSPKPGPADLRLIVDRDPVALL